MSLLSILAAAAFVSAFTIQLINPLVPAIARDFGVSVEQAAMLASAFTFTYALSQPFLGPLGDAIGKARVIKGCMVVLIVGLLLGAIATRFEYLFAARMLAGAAGGGIIPVGFAMIGDRFPVAERQVAIARMVMAAQVAIIIGAMAGGLIAEQFSWRQLFIGPALVGVVVLALAMRHMQPRAGVVRTPMSWARTKAGYAEAISGPMTWITLGGVFFGGMAMFGMLPFIAARLEQRGLGGMAQAGLVLGGLSVGGLVFTLLVRQLLSRLGRGGLVRTGGLTVASGLLGVAFSPSWPFEMAAFIVVGFGYFMVHNSLQALGTELAPHARGSGMALFACLLFLGQAIGPVAYRGLFALLGPSWPILIGGATLLTVALLLARRLDALDRTQSLTKT